MTVTNWDVFKDGWVSFQNATNKYGNGLGPRLQSGRAQGTDDYDNRFYVGFQAPAGFNYALPVTSAIAYYKVRGSNGCFGQGSAPKVLFRRTTNADLVPGENTASSECTLTTNGTIDATRWGTYATTATNEAFWQGTPGANDVISVDVTAQFVAWIAARTTGDKFTHVGMPSNSAGNAEEQLPARKIAFHSSDVDSAMFDGGKGPYLAVTQTSAGTAPSAPILQRPFDGSREVQSVGTRAIWFTYQHPTGDAGTDYNVVVATSATVSGGALTTGIVVNKTVTTPLVQTSTSVVTLNIISDYAPDEARGTTYYWQVRCKANGLWGTFSVVRSYTVNRVPINTKVRPA